MLEAAARKERERQTHFYGNPVARHVRPLPAAERSGQTNGNGIPARVIKPAAGRV